MAGRTRTTSTEPSTPDAAVLVPTADAGAALYRDNAGAVRGKHITEGAQNIGSLTDSLREATRQAQLTEAAHG
jgi:hypothetical protein